MVDGDRGLVAARLGPALARARRAKLGIAIAGGVVFVGAAGLARGTYASHPKHAAQPLGAPRSFFRTVRLNLLRGGVVAPAEAPPQAQTSTS